MTMQPTERWRQLFRRMADRVAAFPRCERGQAIYVVVVFFLLLAGLLMLVINSGEKLNHKLYMQDAADAAAAGGAGWYARGLNTISMCNVTNTQLLSLIVLCDTLETVTPPAKDCIDDLMKNLSKAKAKRDIPLDDRISTWLVVGNGASEQEIIGRFNDIVNAVDWSKYLTYDTGVLWECTKLMDGFAHAMETDTPLAAQREAIKVTMDKDQADFGFVLPLWPALPVLDGQFSDFRNPMEWARLPASLPAPDGNQVIGGFRDVMGYIGYNGNVMGPYNYWREPFTNSRPMGLFDLSRFSIMFNIVSQMKLDMMFGGEDDQACLTNAQWEMDYDRARGLPPVRIRRAHWETVSFNARYPDAEETPAYPLPASGDWNALRDPQHPTPSNQTYGSMDQPNLTGWTRATQAWEGADPREAVWYRVQHVRTPHYPQLGIFAPHPPVHPDGSDWPYTEAEKHTYWNVTLMRFDGAELDNDTTLHRRYLPPLGVTPELGPIFFTPEGTNKTANVNERFTFNGFAYRSGKVTLWPNDPNKPDSLGFENPNPIDKVVGYAQARVYNRYTHDLFTQHWKVKLMRLGDHPDWPAAPGPRWTRLLDELNQNLPDEGSSLRGYLTPDHLKPVRDMLESYTPDFVEEETH
jgi:hypothetical protein